MDAISARRLLQLEQWSHLELHFHERDGRLVTNDRVALPVLCDVSTPREADIEVWDAEGAAIGVLCFTSVDRGDSRPKSEYALSAYFTELMFEDFGLVRPLRHDYLVVESLALDSYLADSATSSAIWGGFVHIGHGDKRCERRTDILTAKAGIAFPLDASAVLCSRAIAAAHPFERFLKHYHQLELLVDWYVAKRISRLSDDLNGFDKIISSYSAGDLPRVKDLLGEFCTDENRIRDKLVAVDPFVATAEKMFQDFGKTGNPITGSKTVAQWLAGPKPGKEVVALAAYWLFRIRCSIAHHRVGEYLIKDSDEEFIVSFAEPLLLEVVAQVLSSKALHRLL